MIERKTATTSNARPSNAEKEREKQRQMKKVHGYQNAPTGGRSSEANLVGNDCLQTYDNMRFAAYSPSNVSGLVAGIVALFYILGPIPALIGISVLIFRKLNFKQDFEFKSLWAGLILGVMVMFLGFGV